MKKFVLHLTTKHQSEIEDFESDNEFDFKGWLLTHYKKENSISYLLLKVKVDGDWIEETSIDCEVN